MIASVLRAECPIFLKILVVLVITQKEGLHVNSPSSFGRLHEQLNESDDAAQCYMLYIQDIFSCGVSILKSLRMQILLLGFFAQSSISDHISSSQEQLEHAEVSTALRYLGQYYFKNKLYDEASLCAQRCCDYNDVSIPA